MSLVVQNVIQKANYHSNSKLLYSLQLIAEMAYGSRRRLFDVSLRDGLQSVKQIYTLDEKKDLLHKILKNHNPCSIEIGSIVNPKVVPQMANSLELHKYVLEKRINEKFDVYMLTPTLKSVLIGKENNVSNFSFISSVSNEFQLKNINKSLKETKKEIENMFSNIDNKDKVKIYLSCVNECLISGINKNERVVEEFMYYYNRYNHKITDICISDTCGTLKMKDFKFIIDKLLNNYGINKDCISLHFHTCNSPDNLTNLALMLYYANENNIFKYDVSCVNDGGCHVTIDKNKLNANVSYDILDKYGF